MNKEYLKWAESVEWISYKDVYMSAYIYLRQHPHLLMEDGEKEYDEFNPDVKVSYGKPSGIVLVPKVDNPRPTDQVQDMEQEAGEMNESASRLAIKYADLNEVSRIKFNNEDYYTALTEFGKMWKERGREEGHAIGREQGKWISVEDRLPEDGQYVLYYRDVNDGIYCATTWDREEVKYYKLNNITHWQPLPSPPKTDNK